ncbi:MAG TPA: MBL fold metallo-hydrolase [Abditibacterium sp.]|jgi:ribonuclease BN (tRNA processing enzyme)
MRVEFLGTAGYHPNAARHTSGILLPDAAPDDAFLLDAGSGTFRLIDRALPKNLHVFLTHAHLDHVLGTTFFLDICHGRDLGITFYGAAETLDAVTNQLFSSPFFPLSWPYQTQEIAPQTAFEVAGVKVNTFPLTHPGGCLAYRFGWPARSLAYVTDTVGDGLYHPFISGVDVLIHERNFPDRLSELALASGHCTSSGLVAAARSSGAKIVIATHFNPLTTEDPLLEDDVYAQIPGVIAATDELCVAF